MVGTHRWVGRPSSAAATATLLLATFLAHCRSNALLLPPLRRRRRRQRRRPPRCSWRGSSISSSPASLSSSSPAQACSRAASVVAALVAGRAVLVSQCQLVVQVAEEEVVVAEVEAGMRAWRRVLIASAFSSSITKPAATMAQEPPSLCMLVRAEEVRAWEDLFKGALGLVGHGGGGDQRCKVGSRPTTSTARLTV